MTLPHKGLPRTYNTQRYMKAANITLCLGCLALGELVQVRRRTDDALDFAQLSQCSGELADSRAAGQQSALSSR